jgi:hypothetical protein
VFDLGRPAGAALPRCGHRSTSLGLGFSSMMVSLNVPI